MATFIVILVILMAVATIFVVSACMLASSMQDCDYDPSLTDSIEFGDDPCGQAYPAAGESNHYLWGVKSVGSD